MTMSKSMPHTDRKKRMVIKLGGSMLEGLNETFFQHLKEVQQTYDVIIVHGGGPAINEALAQANIATHKIDGIRVTDEQAIHLVANTLIGEVNPMLVGQLNQAGIKAIGLNGQDAKLLRCHYLNKEVFGYVGEIDTVNMAILEQLQALNILPVVACIGATNTGQLLNINGDTVACDVALANQADELLFVTDVDGIRIEDVSIQQTTAQQIQGWITTGAIYGGMIPKVEAAMTCVDAGIPAVKIVGATLQGTTILKEKVTQ